MNILKPLLIIVVLLTLISCSKGQNVPSVTKTVQNNKTIIKILWDYTLPEYDQNGNLPYVVAGFRVYHGFSSGNYTTVVDIGSAKAREVVLSNLVVGNQYYFVVTAYAESGAESGYSTEVTTFIDK